MSRRSRKRAAAGAAAVTLISVSLAAPATASGANSLGPEMFGISTGGAIQNEDAATMERDLDAIESAGSRWVRIDINWDQIQAGGPASYDWDPIDRVVGAATERGIKVLGIILYTPAWARPPGTSASHPPDPERYAEFAAAAVEHYEALGVHAYEVWNEPNIARFWEPGPDPAAYAELLEAAYPAIKAADPQATVLTGGTAPAFDTSAYSPVDFLAEIYANGGGDSFDAVAHHPYCWPALPGGLGCTAWQQMHATDPSLRSVMAANGDTGKKIWATEFGAPTGGPNSVTEDRQSQMIRRAYSFWSDYDWGGPLFTYTGRDHGTDTWTNENFFGLLRHDFSEKPSFGAYRRQVTLAESPETEITSGPSGLTNDPTPTFEISSSEPPPQFECRVDSGAWSVCGSPHTTQSLTDGDHSFAARAVDADGNADPTPATRDLTVDATPPALTVANPAAGSATNDSTPVLSGSAGTAPRDAGTVDVAIYEGGTPSGTPIQSFARPVNAGAWSVEAAALDDGEHTVRAAQADDAGNSATALATFEVDTYAPDTTITAGPAGSTWDATPTFEFESPDPDASLFECRIDAGAWYGCSSPHSTAELAGGSHSFAVRAGDPAGNRDPTPDGRSFTVDAAGTALPPIGGGSGLSPPPVDGSSGSGTAAGAEGASGGGGNPASGGPAGSLPELAQNRGLVVQGREVAVKLACAQPAACEGRATVEAEVGKARQKTMPLAGSGKMLTLAKGRYLLDAGETGRVELNLTPAGKRLFREQGEVRAKLVLRGADGEPSETTLRLRKRR